MAYPAGCWTFRFTFGALEERAAAFPPRKAGRGTAKRWRGAARTRGGTVRAKLYAHGALARAAPSTRGFAAAHFPTLWGRKGAAAALNPR